MAQITSGSLTIVDVTDGAPGLNNTTVFLYRRAVSAPDKPTGNLTYTFSTASITGALEGWVQSIGELTGSDPIWMIAAVASSNGETDVIESSEWAGPIKMAQNGQDGLPGAPGTNGLNQATIFIYKRDDSATAPSSTTYTFATGGFTVPSGWSKTIPTEPKGKPCWVTSAIAIGAEATAELNWVAPSVLVEDGSDGVSPTVTATENGVKIVDADGNETFITNGADGTSYYTFVRYSENADGSGYVVTPTSETIYIGVYTGTKSSPPAYNDSGWTWSRYVGADGQPGTPGSQGPQGVSVASTRELYYLKTNSTDPAQITNASQIHTTDDVNQWTSVVPTYIGSGKYYTCIETTLSNGNVVWSAPVENKGLTDANVNAANAIEIARGVKQHFFWVATDKSENIPAGAYVAEESEESFYSNPTKGNILTRSDGIWIRNGVDKLATLQGSGLTFLVPTGTYKGQKSVSLNGSGLTFYNIGSSNSAAATLASDGLQITNGSIVLGTTGGTAAGNVTLSNKNFTRSINGTSYNDLRFAIGSKFGVASDGTLYSAGLDSVVSRVDKAETHLTGMYATSSTAADANPKVATIIPAIPSGTTWTLETGTTVTVKFVNGNTKTGGISLNVNGTGAKTIRNYEGNTLTLNEYDIKAGSTLTFTYDGTYWRMQDSTASVRMNNAETEITQNAEAIVLEASRREMAVNMLLDSDVPSLTKVNALHNRYWSDAGQESWCTPSIIELSDPPDQSIHYACRFVATASNHTNNNMGRAIAFYSYNGLDTSLPLKVGTKYTVSYWARCTSGQGRSWVWYSYKKNSAGTDNNGRAAVPITDLTSTWEYFTGTVELENETLYNRIWFYAYFPANTAGTVEICGMKLVAGDNVEAYATTIEQTANNVLIKATKNDTTDAAAGKKIIESFINVNPETVKISSKNVEIDGAAIFNAIGQSGGNLLVGTQNPVIKTGGKPYYSVVSGGDGVGTIATITDSPVVGYSKSFRITNNTTGNRDFQQQLPELGADFSAGEWLFTAWVRGIGGNATAIIRSYPYFTYTQSVTTSWTKVQCVVKLSGTFSSVTSFQFGISGAGAIEYIAPTLEIANRAVHTLQSSSSGSTYANILTWCTEGRTNTSWGVTDVTGVQKGDMCRVAYKVTDMNNAIVYPIGEITNISGNTIYMTMHGLDTTVIDGGNILTNSIGANQIKSHAITADKISIGDYTNYITATENDTSSLIPGSGATISSGWLYKPAEQGNLWISPVLNQWAAVGEQYRITGVVRAPAAGRCLIQLLGRDASGNFVASSTHTTLSLSANTDTVVDEIVTITAETAACPKINIAAYFYSGSSGSTPQAGYLKRMRCERIGTTGGENLLLTNAGIYRTSYNCLRLFLTEPLIAGQQYTLQFWGVSFNNTPNTDNGLAVYIGGGTHSVVANKAPDSSGYWCATFVPTATQLSSNDGQRGYLQIFNTTPENSKTARNVTINRWKLEKGRVGTDWSLAPANTGSGENILNGTGNKTLAGSGSHSSGTFRASGGTVSSLDISAVGSHQYLPEGINGAVRVTNNGSSATRCGCAQDTITGYFVTGQQYTISGWLRCNTSNLTVNVQPAWVTSSQYALNSKTALVTSANVWQYFSDTAVMVGDQSDHYSAGYVYVNNLPVNAYFDVCGLKVEKGNKATGWSEGAETKANTYITHINDSGIQIHPKYTGDNNYLSINSDAIAMYRANVKCMELTATELAFFSPDTQKRVSISSSTGVVVGRADKGHTLINDNGLYVYDSSGTRSGYFTGNYAVIGTETAGNFYHYLYPSGFQVRKQVDASNTTAYLTVSASWFCFGDPGGTRITMTVDGNSPYIYMNANGAQCLNADKNGLVIGNPSSGHSWIKSDGLHVWTGADSTATNEVAFFGATARIGKQNKSRVDITPSSISMSDDSNRTVYEVTQSSSQVTVTRVYNIVCTDESALEHDTILFGRTVSSWVSTVFNYKVNGTSYTKTYTSDTVDDHSGKYWFSCSAYGSSASISYGCGTTATTSDKITIVSVTLKFTTGQTVIESTLGAYAHKTMSGPFRVGNGIGTGTLASNAMLVDWAGNAYHSGDVVAYSQNDSSGGMSLTRANAEFFVYSYSSGSNYLDIHVYRVGRLVMLEIDATKTSSTASGSDIFSCNLSSAQIPQPVDPAQNVTGATYYGAHAIGVRLCYESNWKLIVRNASNSAVTITNGIHCSLTYICDMHPSTHAIVYTSD